MWYVSSWKSHSGRRGAHSPTQDEQWAKDLQACLNDPKSKALRRFSTREEAFRFYYRVLNSR